MTFKEIAIAREYFSAAWNPSRQADKVQQEVDASEPCCGSPSMCGKACVERGQWLGRREGDAKDAARYEYILDCEVAAAQWYITDLDIAEFKAKRRAKHDAAIADKGTNT